MTEFIRPFGPSIYHGKMEPNEIELLQKIAKQTLKIRQNVGYTLVGNIHDQLGIAIEDEDEQVKFMDILHPHVYAFAKHEGERQQHLLAKQRVWVLLGLLHLALVDFSLLFLQLFHLRFI